MGKTRRLADLREFESSIVTELKRRRRIRELLPGPEVPKDPSAPIFARFALDDSLAAEVSDWLGEGHRMAALGSAGKWPVSHTPSDGYYCLLWKDETI